MPSPFDDLEFTEVIRHRPFHVVAPEFATAQDIVVEPPAVGPVAPYAGVEVDLRAARGRVRIGLTDLGAAYDARRGLVTLEATDAEGVRVLRRKRVRLPAGSTLGFALCESQATVLARRPGERWRPLLTEHDLREPAVLARQRWHWSGSETDAGEVRYGPFGMTGLRDPHLVQHADGSAYQRDGRVFCTWTCAGLGGFRQAHWGVFALDPADPGRMEQTAQLYGRRDGHVYGDHAGQLVRDGEAWRVAVSTWGDVDTERGVAIRHAVTDADLLHGVHVLDTEPVALPLPQGTVSAWDPCFQRDGDGWLVAFVVADSLTPFRFRPVLARAPGPDPWAGLARIGVADGLGQTEGPVLVRRDGATWLLASDGAARRFRVFDAVLRPVGDLRAAYPTNIPHPQLLRRDDGSWLMLTFDGTAYEPRRRHSGRRPVMGYGGHGDVVVLEAREGTR